MPVDRGARLDTATGSSWGFEARGQSAHFLDARTLRRRNAPPRTGTALSPESGHASHANKSGGSTKCEIAVSISALVYAEVWGEGGHGPPPTLEPPIFAMAKKYKGGGSATLQWGTTKHSSPSAGGRESGYQTNNHINVKQTKPAAHQNQLLSRILYCRRHKPRQVYREIHP